MFPPDFTIKKIVWYFDYIVHPYAQLQYLTWPYQFPPVSVQNFQKLYSHSQNKHADSIDSISQILDCTVIFFLHLFIFCSVLLNQRLCEQMCIADVCDCVLTSARGPRLRLNVTVWWMSSMFFVHKVQFLNIVLACGYGSQQDMIDIWQNQIQA